MKATHLVSGAAIILTALALTGCKGRTLENVEPTGDTVEVVVATDTVPSVSAGPQTDSATEVASDNNKTMNQ